MKIKSDFVTNSSSTCYVVLVPDNFVVQDEMLDKIIKEAKRWEYEEDFPSNEEIKTGVSQNIEILKGGSSIWSEYDNEYIIYTITESVMSDSELVVASVEVGPDGGMLQGISAKKVMEVLMNTTDLTKICKVTRSEDVK